MDSTVANAATPVLAVRLTHPAHNAVHLLAVTRVPLVSEPFAYWSISEVRKSGKSETSMPPRDCKTERAARQYVTSAIGRLRLSGWVEASRLESAMPPIDERPLTRRGRIHARALEALGV